jgi:ssDNA-binding Zn-finger/Zn-ribbon topoisomerase 1
LGRKLQTKEIKTMGPIAHIQVKCPNCEKITNAYIEESNASQANVKCEHCKKVFVFGSNMLYKPIGYVSAIPQWARIEQDEKKEKKEKEKKEEKPVILCANCAKGKHISVLSEFIKSCNDDLAIKLAHPKKPFSWEKAIYSPNEIVAKFWNFFTTAGYILGFLGAISADLITGLLIVLATVAIRYGGKAVLEMVDRPKLTRWQLTKNKWDNLFYCKDCGYVFNPKDNRAVIVDGISEYLQG